MRSEKEAVLEVRVLLQGVEESPAHGETCPGGGGGSGTPRHGTPPP